jgi:hypothetical protein
MSICLGDISQDEKITPFNFQAEGDNKMTTNLLVDELIFSPNSNDIIVGHMQHWIDCEDLPIDSDESKDELLENDLSLHNDDGIEMRQLTVPAECKVHSADEAGNAIQSQLLETQKKNFKIQFIKSNVKQKKHSKENENSKNHEVRTVEAENSKLAAKDN